MRHARGATVVRRAAPKRGEMKDADMSAIGLDDIMNLMDDAESNAQAKWLPGSYAPDYLNGGWASTNTSRIECRQSFLRGLL